MRNAFILIALLFFTACETGKEEKAYCLPVNMTATIIEGTEAKKIIADFHYRDSSELLDHITWSNHQTHYFEFDEAERMTVVRKKKVDAKVTEEYWFHYDGNLVDRVDLVTRHLDYVFLEPVDSVYTGYLRYDYEGKYIKQETRYNAEDMLEATVAYAYDSKGNITSRIYSEPDAGALETVVMSYDSHMHPYVGLQFYFEGESFINNMLTRTLEEEQLDYTYDIRLNEQGYPETIYEQLGATNTRIIRYVYSCP